ADLREHAGRSIVIAGEWTPPGVHLLAHAMNAALGNAGASVRYIEPVDAEPVDHAASLRELVEAMGAGQVELLVMIDTNPAYAAPGELEFVPRLANVKTRVHYGLYVDETAELSHWHVPATHYLESWSDTRAYDGTATIIQPLIAPLYAGKTAHELVAALLGAAERSSYDLVRGQWQRTWAASPADFEPRWRRAVHDGVVSGSALPEVRVSFASTAGQWGDALPPPPARGADALDLVFRPDSSIYDGR